MRKLLLTSLLALYISHSFAHSNGKSYWQEYGPAKTIPFTNQTQDSFKQLIIEKGSKINLVMACDDQLSQTAILEFFKIFLNEHEQPPIVYQYKLNEFEPITQPIGIAQSKIHNEEQIAKIKKKYLGNHKDSQSLVAYVATGEFLLLDDNEISIHQLVTVNYNGENYNYVSVGIQIDQDFYNKYLKLPNNDSRAYKISYALEKAYATNSKHWQLSVTNYKLTKLTHLKTAVARQI